MAWVEGVTSSNRILRDLVNIMVNANKDVSGDVVPEQNWELVFPRPYNLTDVVGETLTQDSTDSKKFKASKADWFTHKKPDVYITVEQTTDVVLSSDYTVNYLEGTITFHTEPAGVITCDYTYVTDRDLATGIAKIAPYGNVIVKTTTTPVAPDNSADPFNTDPDLKVAKLTMYMEIEKPRFLINPETGQSAAKYGETTMVENHYHINMRIFDHYDYNKETPKEKIIDDATGITLDEGAHISNWAKFSWYQDFKEFLVDELDSDPGTGNISDGIVFTFLDTPGVYGELPIQYWISTNNDRLAMVLMGEPSINYDNYITSFAYAGKIDSFEGGVNDTAGNFALTTGSSTIPCVANPNPDPIVETVQFAASVINPAVNGGGTYQSWQHKLSYKIVPENEHGEGLASQEQSAVYTYSAGSHASSPGTNAPTQYNNFKLDITAIPANATKLRIYRKNEQSFPTSTITTNWFLESTIDVTGATMTYTPTNAIDATKPVPITNYDASSAGVLRDQLTGSVMEVRFPRNWGVNTATGTNDIAMYKARSGDGTYFQKHQVSFITPEEYMKKDAFNPSRWTNKFHLSPMYIVHGYDGYRGWLKDIVAVDDSAIVHLDELIVNKGKANEEIYKYFKLTAPFSMMQNSANTNYGIGIKKV